MTDFDDFAEPMLGVEYSRTEEGMKSAIERAQENGFTVIYPDHRQLTLDFDNDETLNKAILNLLCQIMDEIPSPVTRWTSKSGGTHMLITFQKKSFTEAEAIALEASLGSDLKRAMLYVMRLKCDVEKPRMLFLPPGQTPILCHLQELGL